MKSVILILTIIVTLLIEFGFTAVAQTAPQGPSQITKGANDRRSVGIDNTTHGTVVQAQAGNVTALNINSTRLTSRWQGYYGNITGRVTLDDASNNTLFDWELASPRGEIYASNGTDQGVVVWTNVFCFNYTNNLSGGSPIVQRFNGTDVERNIGANAYDVDSLNRTFNGTFTGSFQVAGATINSNSGCRQTTLYVNDQYQPTRFVEVLLTDNSSIIYTALLEQDQIGFQGAAVDFEMIVGENGDSQAATNYYFFVELA